MALGSTFYTFHAIASDLSPYETCSCIEVIEADTFKIYSFSTPTGTKFFCITDTNATNVQKKLISAYDIYCDYVMKNPFYTYEQVIKCDLFDQGIKNLFAN